MLSRSIRLALVLCALALVPVAGARAATTWTSVPTGTSDTITAIAGPSASQLVFATASGHIFHEVGGSFTASSVSPAQPLGFTDIAMSPDGTHGVAVGAGGAIYSSTNSGATWTKLAVTPTEPNGACGDTTITTSPLADNLSSVQFADANTVYVTGARNDVLKSTNGGTSFIEQNRSIGGGKVNCFVTPNEPLGDSQWVDANHGFFISTYFGDIFSTSDGLNSTIGGKLGEALNSFGQPVALALDPANPQQLWAVAAFSSCGTLCLESSTNGGSTWNGAQFDGHEVALRDVTHSGSTTIAVGDSGDIYTSTDGSHFFRQPALGSPTNNWHAVVMFGGNVAYVGGANGVLLVSSTANQSPVPTATISGPTALTTGQTGFYTATVSDPGGFNVPESSFNWSTPGLAPQPGSSSANFSFSTPGAHVITVTFADAAGATGSAQITVSVTGGQPGGGILPPPSGSNPTITTTGGATITIFRHVTVKGRKGRFIPVVLKANKPRKFVITLVTLAKHHPKTLATLKVTINHGTRTVHLAIANSVKSGSYRLVVKVFTTGKHSHGVGRSVKQVFVLT
jgi:photosystem II stability/assembly factor-like uncharacterized protein